MAAYNEGSNEKEKIQFDLEKFLIRHIEEVEELIEQAKTILQRENALCEIGIPVNIVGDIHGQRIFTACGIPGNERYLFLGDYVDRGPQSLECICLLLALKIREPTRVFLLRGNHECDYVNRNYGFWDELQKRFLLGPALRLFKDFNDLFNYFPLAALIKNRILCMHGGLSPHLNTLDDIRQVTTYNIQFIFQIQLPVTNLMVECLAQDLLWADPKYDLKGFDFNSERECSVRFGKDVVYRICKKFDIDLIVRAHQNNRAAILKINKNLEVSFVILNPVTHQTAGEEHFRKTFKEDSQEYSSCI